MKAIATYFGKEVLRDVDEKEFFAAIPVLREKLGDRPVLRAMHFFGDNARVAAQVASLREGRFEDFLNMIKASGDSSFKMYILTVTCRTRQYPLPLQSAKMYSETMEYAVCMEADLPEPFRHL